MWKTVALLALSIIRKKIKLDGQQSAYWDQFVRFLRSL